MGSSHRMRPTDQPGPLAEPAGGPDPPSPERPSQGADRPSGTLAVAGLVSGIIAAILGLIPFGFLVAWIAAIAAFILGTLHLGRAGREPRLGRRGMAKWGIALGGASVLFSLAWLVATVVFGFGLLGSQPEPGLRQVGQSGVDGGVSYTLRELREARSVPRVGGRPLESAPGSRLLVATIEVRNDSDRRVDPFCGGGAVLVDQSDRNFPPLDQSIAIEGSDVCKGPLATSRSSSATLATRTAILAFEVPDPSAVAGLFVWNAEEPGDPGGERSELIFSP